MVWSYVYISNLELAGYVRVIRHPTEMEMKTIATLSTRNVDADVSNR